MTLPLAPPITITQIAAEFSIPATSIFPGAFYGLGGAPASGVLGFLDFLGRSAGTPTGLVDIYNVSCDAIAIDPADANANFALNASGMTSGSGVTPWAWLLSGAAGDYAALATVTSGSFFSGTFGSWLPLSTTRSWAVVRTAPGVANAQMQLQIRRISDSVLLDNAQVAFNATVEI